LARKEPPTATENTRGAEPGKLGAAG